MHNSVGQLTFEDTKFQRSHEFLKDFKDIYPQNFSFIT